mmetsp:Transcript_33777/g.96948  ORF Transcript_33777/g.96948 Transcript_33777/m.96948 type:complete len:213 (+) Transcript_33777:1130-1768(+)
MCIFCGDSFHVLQHEALQGLRAGAFCQLSDHVDDPPKDLRPRILTTLAPTQGRPRRARRPCHQNIHGGHLVERYLEQISFARPQPNLASVHALSLQSLLQVVSEDSSMGPDVHRKGVLDVLHTQGAQSKDRRLEARARRADAQRPAARVEAGEGLVEARCALLGEGLPRDGHGDQADGVFPSAALAARRGAPRALWQIAQGGSVGLQSRFVV